MLPVLLKLLLANRLVLCMRELGIVFTFAEDSGLDEFGDTAPDRALSRLNTLDDDAFAERGIGECEDECFERPPTLRLRDITRQNDGGGDNFEVVVGELPNRIEGSFCVSDARNAILFLRISCLWDSCDIVSDKKWFLFGSSAMVPGPRWRGIGGGD